MLQVVGSIHSTPEIDVATTAICEGLDMPTAARVVPLLSVKRYRAKQTVFFEGDPAEHVFEVVEGVLTLYKQLPDGRRQITGFLYPGHYFGLALEDGYVHTAEAATELTLCRYPRARLDQLVDEAPSLARRLLALTANELAAAQDQMLLLGRKSAVEKIASFLLSLSGQKQAQGEDGEALYLPMCRSDIGDYLGLTVETVSRTFTKLRKDKVIDLYQHNTVTLLDIDRLEDLAEGAEDAVLH